MTIVYTWKVNNLERDVADDYVTTVHYGVDAVDGEHSQGAYALFPLTRPLAHLAPALAR